MNSSGLQKSINQNSMALVLVPLIAATLLLMFGHLATPSYPSDSYFYLSKARSLVAGKGLTVNWNDGHDAKYFPGYSILVGLVDLIIPGDAQPWFALHVLLLWAGVLMSYHIFRRIEEDSLIAAAAAGLFSLHFVVIKWSVVPSAEPLALVFALLAVILFIEYLDAVSSTETVGASLRQKRVMLYFFGACLAAGCGFATRFEARYLWLVALIYIIFFKQRNRLPRARYIIAGLFIFMLPFLIWIIWNKSPNGFLSLRYVPEFLGNVSFEAFFNNISKYIVMLYLTKTVVPQNLFFNNIIFLTDIAAVVSLFWCLRGFEGKRYTFSAIIVFGYLILHSFWYYAYERFVFLITPLLCLLLVRFFALFIKGMGVEKHVAGTAKMIVFVALTILLSTSLAHYSWLHIKDHAKHLVVPGMDYKEVAAKAELLAGESGAILSQWGSPLAYFIRKPVFIDTEDGYYYKQMFKWNETAQFIRENNVRVFIIRPPIEEWMYTHEIPYQSQTQFRIAEQKEYYVILIADLK